MKHALGRRQAHVMIARTIPAKLVDKSKSIDAGFIYPTLD